MCPISPCGACCGDVINVLSTQGSVFVTFETPESAEKVIAGDMKFMGRPLSKIMKKADYTAAKQAERKARNESKEKAQAEAFHEVCVCVFVHVCACVRVGCLGRIEASCPERVACIWHVCSRTQLPSRAFSSPV